MLYDLHTHSTASDGKLAPSELLAFATAKEVTTLAITDHDTVDAYAALGDLPAASLRIVTGIELSTTWAARGIHIVGLNIELSNPDLLDGIAQQQTARTSRARRIGERLERCGIENAYAAARDIAGTSTIGRPHFAQYLVDQGHAKDQRAAFRKYLGTGKPGDVRNGWASMPEVIGWIRAAGGVAVLAHPAKYQMTNTKLSLLLSDFKSAGGLAMEVVSGQQTLNVTENLARLALEFGLAASCGSDFHDPAQTWSLPGQFPALPARLPRVWDLW